MDLNQLLYRRLSQDNLLNGTLAKYADKPAIFNTEFPPDQQEGWNGKSQYPRISYVFNKQVDTKRSSSGQLTAALYDIMDPLEVEKMEVAIRNCLQDVVMKPEGEALGMSALTTEVAFSEFATTTIPLALRCVCRQGIITKKRSRTLLRSARC